MSSANHPLAHTSARVLEFESLRDLLRGYTSSPLGAKRVSTLAPSSDAEWIERQQQLTTEIREYRRVGGSFEFSRLLDIDDLFNKSRIAGAALETTEIRDVILVADRAAEWREISNNPPAAMRSDWAAVNELSERHRGLQRFPACLPQQDSARRYSRRSCVIRTVTHPPRNREAKRQIQESLRSYLRRLAEGGTVQDELVTIRGERFVIPVKIEQKRRVQGVVHGASSSGQTVFVEPIETIEQNNELVRLLDEEQAEIHRILIEMTRRISARTPTRFASAAGVLSELELQFAKAQFAEDYGCVAVSLRAPSQRPSSSTMPATHC